MKKSGLVLLVVLVGFALQGCMGSANGKEEPPEKDQAAAIPVEVATVKNGDIAAFYSGTTTIESDKQATVVSQITGVVLELHAEEGDFVKAGTVLAKVETDRYQLELERGNALLKRLEMDYQRKRELYRKQLVSADDFERARADYEAQKASVELAALDLQHTSIKAPISGYVGERLVRVGNLVTVHQPVFRINSYDPLLAVLHVPERELRVLRKGLTVSVSLDALPDRTFHGEVTRISPVVDPATGTFRVTAKIDDPRQLLKPGLFGRVDILYDQRKNVPLIPRSAIVTEDESSHVFVVKGDNNAALQPITLGYERNGLVEVVKGLSSGERVVTAGKGSLSDGARVEVVGLPQAKPRT